MTELILTHRVMPESLINGQPPQYPPVPPVPCEACGAPVYLSEVRDFCTPNRVRKKVVELDEVAWAMRAHTCGQPLPPLGPTTPCQVCAEREWAYVLDRLHEIHAHLATVDLEGLFMGPGR